MPQQVLRAANEIASPSGKLLPRTVAREARQIHCCEGRQQKAVAKVRQFGGACLLQPQLPSTFHNPACFDGSMVHARRGADGSRLHSGASVLSTGMGASGQRDIEGTLFQYGPITVYC